ncbi:MAG: tetratricopeptide repeat protein [Myxococcota bacterium]
MLGLDFKRLPLLTMLTLLPGLVAASGCQAVQSQLGPKLQRHDAEPKLADDACRVGDAQQCLEKCHAGHAKACNSLAMMYEFGLRAHADYKRAAAYYQTSCAADFSQGCTNLGWLYAVGRGVERNGKTALILFTKAFEGYRAACLNGEIQGCLLAVSHLQQGLVDEKHQRDELVLLEHACQLGHEPSCTP